jgi:hypothetical protein
MPRSMKRRWPNDPLRGRESQRPDGTLDGVGVHLDAPVVREQHEAVPVVKSIADGLAVLDLPGKARSVRAAAASLCAPAEAPPFCRISKEGNVTDSRVARDLSPA